MANMVDKFIFTLIWISILLNLTDSSTETDQIPVIQLQNNLSYDFYHEICPNAEKIVRSTMEQLFSQHNDTPAQLLRLLFHDCFIQGCDASVFLDDGNGNKSRSERHAIPNRTLKGFDKIELIKQEIEKACPGVVSCADILVIATRDGIVLGGGPFYPVPTGRSDSTQSFYDIALAEIPPPDGNITQTLRLFSLKGFNERETVTLLGAHNIGKISCEFIESRLSNFKGTGEPDRTIPPDFLNEIRLNCQVNNTSDRSSIRSRGLTESTAGMSYLQGLTSISSGAGFDTHYYQSLIRGRGLLFADQQLMANNKTAKLVMDYASDDGTAFRVDFARVMVKMSRLGSLNGSQGQVRLNCSIPVTSS